MACSGWISAHSLQPKHASFLQLDGVHHASQRSPPGVPVPSCSRFWQSSQPEHASLPQSAAVAHLWCVENKATLSSARSASRRHPQWQIQAQAPAILGQSAVEPLLVGQMGLVFNIGRAPALAALRAEVAPLCRNRRHTLGIAGAKVHRGWERRTALAERAVVRRALAPALARRVRVVAAVLGRALVAARRARLALARGLAVVLGAPRLAPLEGVVVLVLGRAADAQRRAAAALTWLGLGQGWVRVRIRVSEGQGQGQGQA